MTQRGTRLGRLAAGFGLGCVTLAGAQPCELVGTGWTAGPEHVRALEWIDLGDGGRLYAGFPALNGVWVSDGDTWTEVRGTTGRSALALIGFDDGTGSALYAGSSSAAGGSSVARYRAGEWEVVGTLPSTVRAMGVYDDGSGPALYAAGAFDLPDGSNIARWDGTAWSAVGGGVDGQVEGLQVFDDGRGPALYAAGSFATAGGVPAAFVARWDGQAWSAVGDGPPEFARKLVVFDEGAGERLFAMSGVPIRSHLLYRWSGTGWEGVGEPSFIGLASDVTVHDDGRGPAIYTIGNATRSRTNGAHGREEGPFRWDGTAWESSYNLIDTRWTPWAIVGGGDGQLYIASKGPYWERCGDWNLVYTVVRLSCFPHDCTIDLNCDGVVDGADLVAFLGRLSWGGDINNDGFGNFFDVVEFLRRMDIGCGNAR